MEISIRFAIRITDKLPQLPTSLGKEHTHMAPDLLLQSIPIILRLTQFNCKQKNLIRPVRCTFFPSSSWMADNWLAQVGLEGAHDSFITWQTFYV